MSPAKKIVCPKCQTQMVFQQNQSSVLTCTGCATKLRVGGNSAAKAPDLSEPASHRVIQCPKCTKRLRIPTTSAGNQFKCPGCSTLLKVPVKTASASRAASPERRTSVSNTSRPSSSADAFDFKDLPDPNIATASGGTAMPAAAQTNPYGGGKARRTAPKKSKMDPALKRFLILAGCTFLVSAIPLLGILLGMLAFGVSMLVMVIAYFMLLIKIFEVDPGMGMVSLAFPPLMGQYLRDDWKRYRKPAIMLFTALGCALIAVATAMAQVFLLDANFGK